jgi:hypothetical protein
MSKIQYTIIEYQYRDASNYKSYGEILIEGIFSKDEVKLIHSCMYDNGEYFIPEEIGIPPLQKILWEKYNGPNEDDHEWHTIECIRNANQEDMKLPLWGTKQFLIDCFQKNWETKPDWLRNNHF